MARLPRYVLPGQPQHVIQRGNNREPIFCCDADCRFYLEKLKAGADKHQVDIHAYVLMTNHVHLLLTPHTEQGMSKLMQYLGRYYVQYFNDCYQRTGTLWEGRYKATVIDAEAYLLTCYRYIELNPVRAGMVEHPGGYRWSSYLCNATGQEDVLVTPHLLYRRLGRASTERQAAYRDLFDTVIEPGTLEAIRAATNKAWVLGNDRFKEQIEWQLGRRTKPLGRGGDRKSEAYRKQRNQSSLTP